MTYSNMAFFDRPCCPCDREQMQAHRHVLSTYRSHELCAFSTSRQHEQAHGQGQLRQQTWRCGRIEEAVQMRRT